jgi:hypothetical protein
MSQDHEYCPPYQVFPDLPSEEFSHFSLSKSEKPAWHASPLILPLPLDEGLPVGQCGEPYRFRAASAGKISMWQLERLATNASSGSTQS